MNDHKHVVLCVDDEGNILRALKRLLRKENYQFLTATSGSEGLKVLKDNDVHLVISDQRMPEMSGAEFLGMVKEKYPEAIRVCLTGYTDVDSITESINQGHIYKFFLKPWNDQSLKLEIRQALDQYDLKQANILLHKKVVEKNEELKNVNDNLEQLVRDRTEELEIKNQALERSHAILEDLKVSIIGVGADGMIVIANRMSQSILNNKNGIEVGKIFSHYFEEKLNEMLFETLEHNTPRTIRDYRISSNPYNIDFLPLSGRFQGKGIIVVIYPKDFNK